VSLQQTGPASEGLQRDWPAPALGLERHYGYAFQWFGLSALVVILYVWFQFITPFRRSRRRARDEPASDEPLGLTVHSMPSPNQALDGAEGRRTASGAGR
jgi:hypothetical protein